MNQEFAMSLDLKETLNNSLELIIKRINAQAANIFLIDKKINRSNVLLPNIKHILRILKSQLLKELWEKLQS